MRREEGRGRRGRGRREGERGGRREEGEGGGREEGEGRNQTQRVMQYCPIRVERFSAGDISPIPPHSQCRNYPPPHSSHILNILRA